MSSAFSIALSSLQAESAAINTTGNNLANINTTGFKGSSVDFRDLVVSNLASSSSGMGVARPTNQQSFSQGAMTSSDSPWAAAIQGNGFFMLKNSADQSLYTRDGNFTVSADGTLSTLTGEKVQGWMASPSGLTTGVLPTDIVVPTGKNVPAQPTTSLSFSANLNAAGTAAASTDQLNVTVPIVDSLGNSHTMTIALTKSTTTANTWNYDVTIPSGDLSGGTAGTQTSILSTPGTLTFNADGTLATASQTPVSLSISGLADGASTMNMSWNPLNSDGTPNITQYAETSTYDAVIQDGAAAGQLSNVAISNGGQIMASFSNGQQKVVAQIALADFRNTDSLQDVGNNNFSMTGATAAPSIGTAQSGGRGQIVSGSLEGSNVDIATQFTNLITFQRGYQASSRVITTEDNMLQDLLQTIR